MKRICVFCGSKVGVSNLYRQTAVLLGKLLVRDSYGLVFGGGSVGLMGEIANAVLDEDGDVIGVLPEQLATKELRHPRVSDMRVVASMHARKALMADLSDAFIALPGGLGTFEELFEIVTWAQLGFHRKNIGLLNVAGYYDPLVGLINHAIDEGFIKSQNRDLFVVEASPEALLQQLATHQMPHVRRWLGPDEI